MLKNQIGQSIIGLILFLISCSNKMTDEEKLASYQHSQEYEGRSGIVGVQCFALRDVPAPDYLRCWAIQNGNNIYFLCNPNGCYGFQGERK